VLDGTKPFNTTKVHLAWKALVRPLDHHTHHGDGYHRWLASGSGGHNRAAGSGLIRAQEHSLAKLRATQQAAAKAAKTIQEQLKKQQKLALRRAKSMARQQHELKEKQKHMVSTKPLPKHQKKRWKSYLPGPDMPPVVQKPAGPAPGWLAKTGLSWPPRRKTVANRIAATTKIVIKKDPHVHGFVVGHSAKVVEKVVEPMPRPMTKHHKEGMVDARAAIGAPKWSASNPFARNAGCISPEGRCGDGSCSIRCNHLHAQHHWQSVLRGDKE
jgi:hypothetical protein